MEFMRARASFSPFRAGVAFGGSALVVAIAFMACRPAPVVVTNADEALLVRPQNSASATSSASAKPPPLLVPEQTARELPPFSCPPDRTIELLGSTFCVVLEPRNWHDAEAHCQDIGAHLAVMKNSSLPNALRQAMVSPTEVERFWIGLAEPTEGRWIWSNGAPMKFAAFRKGEPNNAGRGEDCGEWVVEDGGWNDGDCFRPLHFLCEAPTSPPGSRVKAMACPGKRFTIGKTDYCLQGPATWEVAQKTCFRDGGELAMIDTEAENASLFEHLGAKFVVANVWIGLSDEADEGQFRWISGDPLESSAWRTGEPNNVGNEDCVEWIASDGRWNDLPCSISRPSLCEKPAPVVAQ